MIVVAFMGSQAIKIIILTGLECSFGVKHKSALAFIQQIWIKKCCKWKERSSCSQDLEYWSLCCSWESIKSRFILHSTSQVSYTNSCSSKMCVRLGVCFNGKMIYCSNKTLAVFVLCQQRKSKNKSKHFGIMPFIWLKQWSGKTGNS